MDSLFEQFDPLDFVLALFGALIVAMWFGRGKSLKGILVGALVGGLVKPILFGGLLLGGVQMLSAGGDDEAKSEISEQDLMKIFGKQ